MRHLIWFVFLFSATIGYSQDSLTLKISMQPRDHQLSDILEFQGIEQKQLDICSPAIKGKKINLSYEVFTEGVVTKKGELTKGAPDMLLRIAEDTFKLKVLCQAQGDSGKFCFYYPRFTTNDFFTLTQPSSAYQLRFALLPDQNNQVKVPSTNDKQAIFVYSLPFQTPDPKMKSYCALTKDGIPPSKWWDVYHVKHYIVFYMQIQ